MGGGEGDGGRRRGEGKGGKGLLRGRRRGKTKEQKKRTKKKKKKKKAPLAFFARAPLSNPPPLLHPPMVPSGPDASLDPSEHRNLPPRTREHEETERSDDLLFDDESPPPPPPPPLSFFLSPLLSSPVSFTEVGLATPESSIRRRRPRMKNGRRETWDGGEVLRASGGGGDGAFVGAWSLAKPLLLSPVSLAEEDLARPASSIRWRRRRPRMKKIGRIRGGGGGGEGAFVGGDGVGVGAGIGASSLAKPPATASSRASAAPDMRSEGRKSRAATTTARERMAAAL